MQLDIYMAYIRMSFIFYLVQERWAWITSILDLCNLIKDTLERIYKENGLSYGRNLQIYTSQITAYV